MLQHLTLNGDIQFGQSQPLREGLRLARNWRPSWWCLKACLFMLRKGFQKVSPLLAQRGPWGCSAAIHNTRPTLEILMGIHQSFHLRRHMSTQTCRKSTFPSSSAFVWNKSSCPTSQFPHVSGSLLVASVRMRPSRMEVYLGIWQKAWILILFLVFHSLFFKSWCKNVWELI